MLSFTFHYDIDTMTFYINNIMTINIPAYLQLNAYIFCSCFPHLLLSIYKIWYKILTERKVQVMETERYYLVLLALK